MIYQNKLIDLAGKVNFAALQKYLTARGWQKGDIKRENVAFLLSPTNDPKFDILIPLDRSFADYDRAIFDAVKKLAIYEKREEIQLINDLVAPPADIVRFRIDDESTNIGLIPLDAGFELLETAKKSLLSAASDIAAPAVFHKRMSHKEAVQFIDSCYLGQTERGSFIASIICPFIKTSEDKPTQITLFASEDVLQGSFTRKVTKKLMTSLVKIKKTIETGNYKSLFESPQSEIVSTNFLESIVELNELTNHSKIEIAITWAPITALPVDVPNSVEISNDYVEPIKSIIDKIRPEIIEPTKEYVGKISQLKADPNAETREDGEITFIFVGEDDKATTAKVILKGTDLHNATKAFDEGKNVRIQGTLKTQGRQRFIEDALFKIIE